MSPRISLASDLAIQVIAICLVVAALGVPSEAVQEHVTSVSGLGADTLNHGAHPQLESMRMKSIEDKIQQIQGAEISDDEGAFFSPGGQNNPSNSQLCC
jgi:hypothetical protein